MEKLENSELPLPIISLGKYFNILLATVLSTVQIYMRRPFLLPVKQILKLPDAKLNVPLKYLGNKINGLGQRHTLQYFRKLAMQSLTYHERLLISMTKGRFMRSNFCIQLFFS